MSRPSQEGRGLKHYVHRFQAGGGGSPLARGARIETLACRCMEGMTSRRPSQEGRGLKHCAFWGLNVVVESPLARGARIETSQRGESGPISPVAPRKRGAD